MEDMIRAIENVYKSGSLSFLLSSYVDRDYYLQSYKECFKDNHIENVTDFNYSKCFNICINISDIDSHVGSQEFEQFLARNANLYRVDVMMSVIAPYALVKYLKYKIQANQITLQSRSTAFLADQNIYDEKIRNILHSQRYTVLDDTQLIQAVPAVVLELQKDTPSVYNCLFEDSSSYYPYHN
ncbi:hypothetical protein ACE3MZ_13565 [Paenibacillus sp. WLX1005]|uniref:hypothetical protein n=1 Tax=Paenibacillus sp. WLX1005 TaxID=3243766 RepID=UPI003983F626